MILFYLIWGVGYASAITQQGLYTQGIYYFDIDGSTSCGASTDTTGTSSTTATAAQKIAQTFIVGFDSSTPKAVITDLAKKYHIGGMYLVGTDDAAGAGFTKSFYASLEAAEGTPLLITSDEEGVVTRYKYPAGSFPSSAQLAQKSDAEITAITKEAGKLMAQNGLSADLAPVLDLRDVGQGLDGRSFSSNPNVVADKAGAFAAGLVASGITPIFKHFPGFDDTTNGSTDKQQVVMKGSIAKTEAPYETLLRKYPKAGVMLSNLYVNALDPNNPSSLSAATVKHLRTGMDFSGLITTDDLSVDSVTTTAGSLPKAVAQSLQAGVTMPLFTLSAGSEAEAENNMDRIISAVQANSASMATVTKSQDLILQYKTGSSVAPAPAGGGASCCGSSGTTLTGDSNQVKVWNYFIGKGLSPAGTAGIMGNMGAESHFDPSIEQNPGAWEDLSSLDVNHGGKGGVGLVQWDGGRRPAVITYLQSQGLTDADLHQATDKLLGGELDYVWKELNTSYKDTLATIQKDTDPAQAAYHFHQGYEGSSDSESAIKTGRMDPAVTFYTKFNGAGATGSSSGTSSGCSSAPVDCTSAQGNAKILCAAKAYDGATYIFGAAHILPAVEWEKQHCNSSPIDATCSVDCSGLVNLAVWDAFGVNLQEDTTSERSDTTHWKKISANGLQPGDLIQPDSGHVEIIDHVQGTTVYTFGAHMHYSNQSQDVSPSHYSKDAGNLYLRYVGPDRSGTS